MNEHSLVVSPYLMLDCAEIYPNDVKKIEWKYE